MHRLMQSALRAEDVARDRTHALPTHGGRRGRARGEPVCTGEPLVELEWEACDHVMIYGRSSAVVSPRVNVRTPNAKVASPMSASHAGAEVGRRTRLAAWCIDS
jgi:hypothetical protein